MSPKEKAQRKIPLTIEDLTRAVAVGLQGSDIFWKQFDVFELQLCRPVTESQTTPFIRMSAEFQFPPNTPTPEIQNGLTGNFMNEQLLKTINLAWPGLVKQWDSGFEGGNQRGWDINFYGYLDKMAEVLTIPPDDKSVTLFRYEKPADEPRDRKLGNRVEIFEFTLDQNDPLVIGPDGAQHVSDLKKQSKAHLN